MKDNFYKAIEKDKACWLQKIDLNLEADLKENIQKDREFRRCRMEMNLKENMKKAKETEKVF